MSIALENNTLTAMEQYGDLLNAQRDAVESDPSDAYMVGLYNGMMLMVCNMDNTHYEPLSVQPPDDHPVDLAPVYMEAMLMAREHPSKDARAFAKSVLRVMNQDIPDIESPVHHRVVMSEQCQ